MTKKEIIAKVDAELKAQGINATPEQIESALAQVASKQELSADDLENVAGGNFFSDLANGVKNVVNKVKDMFTGGGSGGGSGSGGSGGAGGGGTTVTNNLNQTGNTNNQGIQSNQQGGEGTQKNVQSIQTQGDVSL